MKKETKTLIALHLLLMFYSLSGVCSKKAGQHEFLSVHFMLWYGALLLILVIYTIGWQQILKRLPLTIAFANKAVTLVWSVVFGVLLFNETLKWNQLIGCIISVIGVIIYVNPQKKREAYDE